MAHNQKNRKSIKVVDIVVGAIAFEAKQFAEAGRRCFGDMQNGSIPGPIAPGIVCTAFSIELWFKALYCIANPAGEVPSGHDLFRLFEMLPDEMRTALIERCSTTTEAFLQALRSDAKTFETWRYAYEWGAKNPPTKDGLEIMTVTLLLQKSLPTACEQLYDTLSNMTLPGG